MRYLLMIAAFMLTATTPLLAQMGGDAPQPAPAPVEGEEKPADADDGEEEGDDGEENPVEKAADEAAKKAKAQIDALIKKFKGLEELVGKVRIDQEFIDLMIKHSASFDKVTDEKFEDLGETSFKEAYDYAIAADWFKKWSKDNEIKDAEDWLKKTLRLIAAGEKAELVANLDEKLEEIKEKEPMLEMLKEMNPEQYKKFKKMVEDGKKQIADARKAVEEAPDLTEDESKIVEKNMEAIMEAGENDDEDDEEESMD